MNDSNAVLETDVKTTRFFDGNSYFIDEKVNFFRFENTYKVFDDKGSEIGAIKQKLTFGQKLLRLVLSKKMLPFTLEIEDNKGVLLASISRVGLSLFQRLCLAVVMARPLAR